MKPKLKSPAFWPLAGLLTLVLLNTLHDPGFLKVTLLDGHLYGVPVDILTQGSRTMLVALGMTLVIATGGVDLSVGSVVAIAGAVCALLLQGGHSLALTLVAALGAGLLAGSANGLLVARLGVQPIVATLILMVAGRGAAQLIVGGQVVIIARPSFEYLANGFLLGLPFAPLLVAGLYGLTHLVLRRTALGLFLEGVGDNETASRFAGVAAARIKALAYVFCGACAGIAGVLSASNIRAADAYRAGENMELDAIFAVVVGGTALTGGRFTILGAALGALLIQTLTTTMYDLGVPPAIAPVPKALLIIGVALLQSEKVGRWLGGLGEKGAGMSIAKKLAGRHLPLLVTGAIFAALFLTAAKFYPGFLSARVLVSLLSDNAFLGIAATGMTLVIFSGGIDLSVGAVIGFTSIFTATLIEQHHLAPGLAWLLALAAGTGLGAGMGALVYFFRLPPFLITLAGMFLARGAGFWISTDSVGINHALYDRISGYELALGAFVLPANALILLAVMLAGYVVAQHTRFGRTLLAIGGNEQSALLMGLPIGRTKVGVYALNGFCAALAGIVATLYTGSGNPSMGIGLELDAIAVVVIGGTLLTGGRGHMAGTLLGLLVFGTIQAAILFDGRLSSWWTRIVVGGLLLIFILLQRLLLRRKQKNT